MYLAKSGPAARPRAEGVSPMKFWDKIITKKLRCKICLKNEKFTLFPVVFAFWFSWRLPTENFRVFHGFAPKMQVKIGGF